MITQVFSLLGGLLGFLQYFLHAAFHRSGHLMNRLEGERLAAEFTLKALLFGLELCRGVVRLMVIHAQVDELVRDLLHDALALLVEDPPVNI